MLKRVCGLAVALICALCCLGCGGVPAADREYVRSDNVVVPYQFRGGVFGSLTLSCALYGYNCDAVLLAGVMRETETFMTALDEEITTQRRPARDADNNVQKDENGRIVYLPDDEQSTIWRFNHNVGGESALIDGETWTRYPLGEHGYDMLSRAAELNALTDGYFDPTVYPALCLWGLETGSWNNAAAHATLPSPDEVRAVMAHVGVDKIRVGKDAAGMYVAKQDAEVRLDLGAQAKGYAADRLKDIIAAHREIISATVNIAGNLYFVGKGFPDVVSYRGAYYLKGFRDYVAAITDPYAYNPLLDGSMQAPILGLACRDVSAVTSGDYVRRFYWFDGAFSYFPPVGGQTEFSYFCHIIDPKTGFPCNINAGTYNAALDVPYSNKTHPSSTDAREQYADQLTSVTVLDASSEFADVCATALMLMGRTAGLAWMEEHDIDALLLGCDGYYALRYDGGTERGESYSWSNWANSLIAAEGYGITGAEAA